MKKFGSLDVLEVPGAKHAPCVVMFHGYGADAQDLAPISSSIRTPQKMNWYFVNGPLQVPIGPGFSGRAWFPLDLEKLERSLREGKTQDFSNSTPAGLEKLKTTIFEFLNSLNRPPQDIILGGFSQGAMLATELALSAPTNYRGLAILSGTLVRASEWKKMAPQHKGLRFFQSHGDRDALLDPQAAEKLSQLLIGAGLEGHLDMFRGGHEIPNSVLMLLSEFLISL